MPNLTWHEQGILCPVELPAHFQEVVCDVHTRAMLKLSMGYSFVTHDTLHFMVQWDSRQYPEHTRLGTWTGASTCPRRCILLRQGDRFMMLLMSANGVMICQKEAHSVMHLVTAMPWYLAADENPRDEAAHIRV